MSGKLNIADRVEIEEILAHYCHRVDHGDADGWAALFTEDGVFEVEGHMRLQGTDQLRTMPGVVTEQGGGKWRHRITNVATESGSDPDGLQVKAYGLVTDWREGGKPMTFTDYEIGFRRVGGDWRIAKLLARMP
jgi:ketosteroid isomerase-like protein